MHPGVVKPLIFSGIVACYLSVTVHCPHPPCCHLQKVGDTLDGMIDTVSAKHPLASYLSTLKVGGVVVMLGVPDEPMDLPQGNIIMRKLSCSP
jgi:D-arabinose 1-dehydrogenase-like Zn-dependent alcohol dehydrogenase